MPQAGRTIETVESHGKHLEITWDDGLILHTHMRMTGSWHLYRAEEPWRRPYHQLRAAIETAEWVAVCFNAPVVETYREADRRRHPGRGKLGPDLCKTSTDLSDVVDLLLAYPEPEARLRDVMLDQRVMCGVGNVYRCEVLWATELSPWAHVGDLTHHDAVVLVNTAASMLRASAPHGSAGHEPRRSRRARRLRAQRSGLRAVPRDDRRPPRRRARPLAVLVRGLSGPPRPAARRRLARDGPAPGGGEVPVRPALAP